jgi:GNAT superfamily N-acetyltransferase
MLPSDAMSSPPRPEEEIRFLRKGLPMKKGPPGLTVRLEHFDRRRKGESMGVFILAIRRSRGQFGITNLSICHKVGSHLGFKVEANSGVLWDMQIHPEEWRRKGIGSEWLGVMKEFAKSQGAERFYAHNVQSESEGFFAKLGFVRTHDSDWWIMKEF